MTTIETSLAIQILLRTKAAEAFHVVEMVQFSIRHDEGFGIRRVIACLMGLRNGYPGDKNININDLLDSRSQPETVAFPSGAATEAHTAQISPRAEVEAIQADAQRIAEIREEMEAEVWVVCSGCGCEKIAGTKCDNCDDTRGRETDLDMGDDYDSEAFYDRRGRIIREDPTADYDAECKYAEVD